MEKISHNSFAREARALKVAALVEHFDAMLVGIGRDPHHDAADMARTLREQFTPDCWRSHAHGCGQRKPSSLSRAQVIAIYEGRALVARAEQSEAVRLTDAAKAALGALPRKISASKSEYRLFLELADMGLIKLTDRTVRNRIAYYTAVAA